ncbi:hypothetical protein [Flagellimonas oceanensis]|uniref:hypothetical protein n=1 Tax=Flagellimonas oceanensis TaxID=2499163 RepID=UPI0013E0E98B|nr:hypothetical protein [Allomuricauda oceanensis]
MNSDSNVETPDIVYHLREGCVFFGNFRIWMDYLLTHYIRELEIKIGIMEDLNTVK